MSEPGDGHGRHATAVVFGEWGVLILGPAGSGKSALALALLARARVSGLFGALIGDDRIWLEARNGRLAARGAPQTAGMIERRAVGILTAPVESEAVIRLAAELCPADHLPRLPEGSERLEIAGLTVPLIQLSLSQSASDNALAVEEIVHAMLQVQQEKANFA